jgi:PleD family two-component response regulator
MPAVPPAVLFCDLDGFGEVNDRCGHSFAIRAVEGRGESSSRMMAFIARRW